MYFANCNTPQQIKAEFRRLAKQFHPDVGGDNEIMKAINAAYHEMLEKLNGFVSMGSDGKEHTYKYDRDIEQAIMDKVVELLKLRQANFEIEVIGLWVWVSGARRDQKDLLNKNGAKMKWHGKRQRWYWKPYASKTRYSSLPFDQLRNMYGSRRFEQEDSAIVA